MTSVRSPVSIALELATALRMLARETDTLPEVFLRTIDRLQNESIAHIITSSRHTVLSAVKCVFCYSMGTDDGLSSEQESLSSKPGQQSSNPDQRAQDALLHQLLVSLAVRVGSMSQRHLPEQVRQLIVARGE